MYVYSYVEADPVVDGCEILCRESSQNGEIVCLLPLSMHVVDGVELLYLASAVAWLVACWSERTVLMEGIGLS